MIDYIRVKGGVPEPYDKVVFGLICIIGAVITQKIMGLCLRKSKSSQNYRFNTPDLTEIGVLVLNVRKINEELIQIKKQLSNDKPINEEGKSDS
jgi:hypothetical protein